MELEFAHAEQLSSQAPVDTLGLVDCDSQQLARLGLVDSTLFGEIVWNLQLHER
jgi:hypothetical protein